MTKPMMIGVLGPTGRMGQMLVQQALTTADTHLAGGCERPRHPSVGRDIGLAAGLEPVGISITDDPSMLFSVSDAVLEFTHADSAPAYAKLAAEKKKILITGTTGLSREQQAVIEEAAKQVAVVQAMNFSLGLNVLLSLVEKTARQLDIGYDIEILEFHHNNKLDAPSGTAFALGRAAAAGRGVALDDVAVWGRKGQVGARRPGDIGYAVLRGGDIIGDHQVMFAGEGEMIELSHRSTSRHIYALGALRAALWARGKPPGLYGMRDVLGLSG